MDDCRFILVTICRPQTRNCGLTKNLHVAHGIYPSSALLGSALRIGCNSPRHTNRHTIPRRYQSYHKSRSRWDQNYQHGKVFHHSKRKDSYRQHRLCWHSPIASDTLINAVRVNSGRPLTPHMVCGSDVAAFGATEHRLPQEDCQRSLRVLSGTQVIEQVFCYCR